MKTKRTLLFRVGAVVVLLAIGALMMLIGRGHSVYLDNKSLDFNGQTYAAPYKIVVSVDGEQVAKIYNKKREDRGMATCIGQTFTMTVEVTEEKGDKETVSTHTLKLPYGMDGIAINLPALLAGLPEEAYLSEFKIAVEEPKEEEAPPGGDAMEGDFAIGGDI